MAQVIIENNGKQSHIPNGDFIKDICEELGVPFGCKQGVCGTCLIEVIEGMDNLSEKNERENMMGLRNNERLTCQCQIHKGTVKIHYKN